MPYAFAEFPKSLLNFSLVQRSKGNMDGLNGDGIYVPAQDCKPKFVRLANRSARPHERIKDTDALEIVPPVKLFLKILIIFEHAAKEQPSEDGPQPLRPPLMQKIDRAVNLFPPTLSFGKFG
jgi:hypothetical protein